MEADVSIDNLECLSLNTPHEGWRCIAPLPQPISVSDAVYFHDVVLIAGGQGEDGEILTTVYVLKPPRLTRINEVGQGELTGFTGQWTKLSTELPNPVWPNCICRVKEELFLFGECAC